MKKNNFSLKEPIAMVLMVFLVGCGKSHEDRPSNPPEDMVLIPGGTFTMGGRSEEAVKDEFPRHEENIASFYMDATEVTNAQFEKFVEATGYIKSQRRISIGKK